MKDLTLEQMEELDGGSWWDWSCGAWVFATGAAVVGISVASGGTATLFAAYAFAGAYSVAVPTCGVALVM